VTTPTDLDESPVEGPKLPTAKERRAAASRARAVQKAHLLLADEGYLVLSRTEVVEYMGPAFYNGYYSAPPPTVVAARDGVRAIWTHLRIAR
jgi:hypothetical protein